MKKFSCPEQGLSFAVLHCQTVELWNSDLVIEKLWTVTFLLFMSRGSFILVTGGGHMTQIQGFMLFVTRVIRFSITRSIFRSRV